MSGNGGAIEIAKVVRACPDLQDFRYSATRASTEGCMAIAEVSNLFL
jgi:Ran GTPase-activating protein 1